MYTYIHLYTYITYVYVYTYIHTGKRYKVEDDIASILYHEITLMALFNVHNKNTYIYIYVYIYIYIYIYMYMYIYTYIQASDTKLKITWQRFCTMWRRSLPWPLTSSARTPYSRQKVFTATHCNTLQQNVKHCKTLQRTATLYSSARTPYSTLQYTAARCNALLHYAPALELIIFQTAGVHCNTLQHTATHCNTLQHTATHCNTL